MPFFNGVSTDASAYPLNATDIANQINLLFANPNGMVSLAPCSESATHRRIPILNSLGCPGIVSYYVVAQCHPA